ncbi:MAG: zinc ribbon domain-containing protein [Promethearchaeota archaeon]
MGAPRDYIWVTPLIAGILTLISFFTPAVYGTGYGIQEYFWMWGLHYSSSLYGSSTIFIPLEQPTNYMIPIFLSGIFTAIIILFGAIRFIFMANKVRVGRKSIKDCANTWIGMGIMMIIVTIIYIIAIDISVMNYVEYEWLLIYGPPVILPNFWSVYSPGFATIAPFIGAALSIIGGIASKTIKPREVILPMKKEFLKPEISQPSEIAKDIVSSTFKFCPECGHKIISQDQRFCTNCGFELKGIPMTQIP